MSGSRLAIKLSSCGNVWRRVSRESASSGSCKPQAHSTHWSASGPGRVGGSPSTPPWDNNSLMACSRNWFSSVTRAARRCVISPRSSSVATASRRERSCSIRLASSSSWIFAMTACSSSRFCHDASGNSPEMDARSPITVFRSRRKLLDNILQVDRVGSLEFSDAFIGKGQRIVQRPQRRWPD